MRSWRLSSVRRPRGHDGPHPRSSRPAARHFTPSRQTGPARLGAPPPRPAPWLAGPSVTSVPLRPAGRPELPAESGKEYRAGASSLLRSLPAEQPSDRRGPRRGPALMFRAGYPGAALPPGRQRWRSEGGAGGRSPPAPVRRPRGRLRHSLNSSTTQSTMTASRQAVAPSSRPIRASFPMRFPSGRERWRRNAAFLLTAASLSRPASNHQRLPARPCWSWHAHQAHAGGWPSWTSWWCCCPGVTVSAAATGG